MAIPRLVFQKFKGSYTPSIKLGSADDNTQFRVRVSYGKQVAESWCGDPSWEEKQRMENLYDCVQVSLEVFPKKRESVDFFAERLGAGIPQDTQTEALRNTGWPFMPECAYFQQDGAIDHLKSETIAKIKSYFDGKINKNDVTKVIDFMNEMVTPEKLAEAKANAEKGMGGR